VILGDAPAVPKLRPGDNVEAEFEVRGGLLTIANSTHRVGAVSLTLEGKTVPVLPEEAAHMQMRYAFDGENTRVLIFSMNVDSYLEAGALLNIGENSTVKEISAAAYEGFVMHAKTKALPVKFELSQNYPNPFNPTTTLEFALKDRSDWELTVYNVLGQTVTSWAGHDEAGWVTIHWNADQYSSGVYFYKLQAGDFVDTKKMLLLK